MKNATQTSTSVPHSPTPPVQTFGTVRKTIDPDNSTRQILDSLKQSPRTETLKAILHYAKRLSKVPS